MFLKRLYSEIVGSRHVKKDCLPPISTQYLHRIHADRHWMSLLSPEIGYHPVVSTLNTDNNFAAMSSLLSCGYCSDML